MGIYDRHEFSLEKREALPLAVFEGMEAGRFLSRIGAPGCRQDWSIRYLPRRSSADSDDFDTTPGPARTFPTGYPKRLVM
jgi:hypothetical protein